MLEHVLQSRVEQKFSEKTIADVNMTLDDVVAAQGSDVAVDVKWACSHVRNMYVRRKGSEDCCVSQPNCEGV
jgi:hypothetical protein